MCSFKFISSSTLVLASLLVITLPANADSSILGTPTLDPLHTQDSTTYPNASSYSIGNTGIIPIIQYEIDNTTGKILKTYDKYVDINQKSYANGPITYTWNSSENKLNISLSGSPSQGTKSGSNYSGDYVGYSTPPTGATLGGAITVTSSYGTIEGNFIGNKAPIGYNQYSQSQSNGAAIHINGGSGGDITANFIGNTTTASSLSSCGTLTASSGSIGKITGDFIGNYIIGRVAQGGAIRLYVENTKSITGDFIGNWVYGTSGEVSGASIMAGYTKIDGDITGNFINNHAQGPYIYGANISFYSNSSTSTSVNNIIGDFIGNTGVATSTFAQGGALRNSVSSTSYSSRINNVYGNFINNSLDAVSYAYGAAVMTDKTGAVINSINGSFTGNYTKASDSKGGAIYNTGIINNINNASYYNNYAESKSTSGTAQGGAIWTSTSLNFNSTNGFNSTYQGNYIQKGSTGTKLYEAIYANSSSIKLTFNATTNGQYTFNDYINGTSGYDVQFTGDSTGKVNLYNDVKNGDIITDTVTMNLANNEIHNYNFRTLNSNANTKWIVDVDTSNVSNPVADKIVTSASGSSGKVTLNGLNFINGSISDITANNLKIQVLSTQNSNLQLALADGLIPDTQGDEVVLSHSENVAKSDTFDGNANWTSKYETWNESTDIMGTIGLATTYTTNDSIGVTVTRTVTNKSDVTSQGDTLKLVNQSDLATRNFNASIDGETYELTDNLGTATSGIININGKPDGGTTNGTVDLNGHSGFELANETTLNLNNVNLKSGTNTYATLITVSNSEANLNLTNAEITGSIIGTKTFDLTTDGSTNINGMVTNANITNNGILTTTTTNIANSSVNNNNRLNLTGTLDKAISGNGTTYVNENLTLDDDSSVVNVNANGGTLTINEGAAISGTLHANNGTIVLSPCSTATQAVGTLTGSGNIELDIDYSGSAVAVDTINATNLGNGTLTINKLNETGTRKDFSIQVLNGSGDNLKLAIDEAITTDYHKVDVDTVYDADPITNPTNWTDIFNTTMTVTTTTRDLYLENNDKTLTYGITGTDANVSISKTGDTLALVNQSATADRSFNSTVAGETYTAETNLGETKAGILNINGSQDEEGNLATINLGSHTGFELANDTTLNIKDTNITGSDNIIITTNPNAVVNLENSEIAGNINNDAGTLNIGDNVKLGAVAGGGVTNINSDFKVENPITGNKVTLNNDAELSFGTTGSISEASQFVVNSGSVNLQNNLISNTNLGNVVLNNDLNLKIDGNFASKQIDTITVNSITANDNHINIANVNILTPTTDEKFNISFIGEMADADVKANLANAIQYTAGDLAMTPIYKYSVDYDKSNGMLNFTRFGGGGSESFNPAVEATPVAAQAAAVSTMNITTGYSFNHSDSFFALPITERMAKINADRVALNEDKLSFSSTDYNQNLGHIDLDHTNRGVWVKPYTVFENIPLKNGPKVNSITYGTLIGYDSEFKHLKHGWAGVTSGFVGYTGAQLRYSGVDSSANGGLVGMTQTWYKNNFYTALTLSTGAMHSENNTMYGKDNTASIMAGIASKTGYNFEFNKGKFIIQPNWTMSYSFVKTFNYTNAAGVRINSDPLNTIQLNPSIRFIGNIEGWQPYASVGMVWNLLNHTNTHANGVKLPEMSVKPYVEYGIGLQRCWNDKFSAYGQAMVRNAGKNGIALTAGFRWAIGRDKKPVEKVQKPQEELKVSDKKLLKQVKVNNTDIVNPTSKIKKQNGLFAKIRAFFAKMDGEPLAQTTRTNRAQ